MFCKNCNREIADNVRFCTYCGADQTAIPNQAVTGNRIDPNQPMYSSQPDYSQPVYPNQAISNTDTSSMLLLVFAIIFALTGLLIVIIQNFVNCWFEESGWRAIYGILQVINNLAVLLVPLAVKKMPFKIIAFVLITPLVLYWTFNCLKNFIF